MLRVNRLPGSLAELLEEFRPCFTAPTFTTFALLAAGLIARPAGRTVCGMLAGAGLGGVWHHSRAHRFFAAAAWSADAVGLVVLRLAAGWLIPAGAPVVIAVDDTMFRRAGRKVHAVHWAYDGSLKVPKGGKKISRGNTFVIAAVIAELPFLRRPVALPAAGPAVAPGRCCRPRCLHMVWQRLMCMFRQGLGGDAGLAARSGRGAAVVVAEEAGERGDGLLQERVELGLLVAGVLGAECADAPVPLGGGVVLVFGGLPAGLVSGPPPAQRLGSGDGGGGGLARGRGGVSRG